MEKFLQVAIAAAKASAEVIRSYYRGDFRVEIKPDQSPVTVADREAEDLIRSMLLRAFPGHGFYGEETGRLAQDAEYVWLVDPIDGTRSFVAGYGMFSTQIALMHRGQLVVGVSSAPAHHELAWAVKGQGAQLDGKPIRVSDVGSIRDASISTGNLKSLAASERWSVLGSMVERANRTRGYGDYYHYHRLAAGQLHAVIE
ncbi:MAG: inositol monophosphatase family protein, partial [Lysobacterales bacterium]